MLPREETLALARAPFVRLCPETERGPVLIQCGAQLLMEATRGLQPVGVAAEDREKDDPLCRPKLTWFFWSLSTTNKELARRARFGLRRCRGRPSSFTLLLVVA